MSLKHKYKGWENPEERLRNKIQPLFTLWHYASQSSDPELVEVAETCQPVLQDIKDLLDDIPVYYGVIGRIKHPE